MNVQVLADPAGRRVWASPGLSGATHDLTAARTHGLIEALTNVNVMMFADKASQGAGSTVWIPFKRQPQTTAALRTRRRDPQDLGVLTKLHCCPRRATAIVQAILVPHHRREQCAVAGW